jgi:plasmid stability protein
MVRRPGSESDRLTLSNMPLLIKRALILRAQREGKSMEKMVIHLLEKELEPETRAIEKIDRELDV